jgi:ribosomal protein S1
MSLSLKQAMATRGPGVETKYPVGTALTGRVTRVPQEGFGRSSRSRRGWRACCRSAR